MSSGKPRERVYTQDTVHDCFTRLLLQGKRTHDPIFSRKETRTLKKIFTAHSSTADSKSWFQKAFTGLSDPDNYWDQGSLLSYLLTQVPKDGEYRVLLVNCMPSLWDLTLYFAHWPFNATSRPTTNLDFSAFIRAIAFLCGRHNKIFGNWWSSSEDNMNRDTDQPVLEYIFRALATAPPLDQRPITPPPAKIPRYSSHDDVVDIVAAIQPSPRNEWVTPRNNNDFRAIAYRLYSTPLPDLSDLIIPASKLIPIIELSILLVEQAGKLGGTRLPASLIEELKAAQIGLQKVEQISFNEFTNYLDSDKWPDAKWGIGVYTIYDAIALLFGTFTDPLSLRP